MASSSVESQALVNKRHELVTIIQHSVKMMSDKCLGKRLISRETSNKILEKDSINAEKARLLLKNIEDTVTPKLFEEFVTILEEEESHENLAETLRMELQDIKDRRVRTQSYSESTLSPEKENELPNKADHPNFDATVPCVEESIRKRKAPGRIDYAMKDLNNVMENLKFAKLDGKEREAKLNEVKKKLRNVKNENAGLKEKIRTHSETINKLTGLLEKKDEALKGTIPLLENKLAKAQKKNYEAIKESGRLMEQLTYLLKYNSDASKQIEELLADKQALQCNLNGVEYLLHEAEAKSRESNALEANYETVCQQLEDIKEELGQEQNTSRHMYNMSQDQIRKTERVHKCGYCFIIAVVLIFAAVIITFSYCLEDKLNYNIKQCTRTVLNTALEYIEYCRASLLN